MTALAPAHGTTEFDHVFCAQCGCYGAHKRHGSNEFLQPLLTEWQQPLRPHRKHLSICHLCQRAHRCRMDRCTISRRAIHVVSSRIAYPPVADQNACVGTLKFLCHNESCSGARCCFLRLLCLCGELFVCLPQLCKAQKPLHGELTLSP